MLIGAHVAAPRRWAVTQTRRALRALDFSERVLSAYRNRCAMCGMQLRLLDGAHILPVADPDSTDETANGVALCTLHHRAYDKGLVTFDTNHRIHLNENRFETLRLEGLAGGVESFCEGLREIIDLPVERRSRPRAYFIERANILRGWAF